MFRILVLTLISFDLSAQSFNAAPFLSMGNTGIALEGIYSLSSNPAGIGKINSLSIAGAYQRHYMTEDLASQAIYAVIPNTQYGNYGLHLRKYGIKETSSLMTASLSYVRNFGERFLTSISANFHQYAVENYVNTKAFSGDLGIQYHLDKLILGMHYRNVSQSYFDREFEQRIPHELGIGATYLLSGQLLVSADYIREFPSQMDIRTGLEYRFDNRFQLRGGASSHPTQYFAGIGMLVRNLQVDIASSFHARLGTSPQLALHYAF